MNSGSLAPLLSGSLVTSVVGAVLLLATDFGGWYYRAPYGGIAVDRYGSIGLFTGYFPIILIFVAILCFSAYASYINLRAGTPSGIRRAYLATLGVFLALLLAGAVYSSFMIFQDVEEWWLDTGFYGGTIGSGLAALLLRLASGQSSEE